MSVSVSVCVCVCVRDGGGEKESSVYGLRDVIISLSAVVGVELQRACQSVSVTTCH